MNNIENQVKYEGLHSIFLFWNHPTRDRIPEKYYLLDIDEWYNPIHAACLIPTDPHYKKIMRLVNLGISPIRENVFEWIPIEELSNLDIMQLEDMAENRSGYVNVVKRIDNTQ